MQPIVSSSMTEAGYNAETKELTIKFISGNSHTYKDVPADVYENFLKSDSKGKYFGKEIRAKYKSEKVEVKK